LDHHWAFAHPPWPTDLCVESAEVPGVSGQRPLSLR
jgi:hypothetical protein